MVDKNTILIAGLYLIAHEEKGSSQQLLCKGITLTESICGLIRNFSEDRAHSTSSVTDEPEEVRE